MMHGPTLRPPADMIWIGDYAAHGAKLSPNRLALVVPERGVQTTFHALEQQIQKTTAYLRAAGVGRGDRVAYLGKNSDLYYLVLFAAIRLGAIVVPINWRCAAPEVEFFLADSTAVLLFCDREFFTLADSATANLTKRPRIVPTEPATSWATSSPVTSSSQGGDDNLRQAIDHAAALQLVTPQDDAVCLQLYTSGTTGRPKGVLCTQQALTLSREAEVQMPDFPDWQQGTCICAMPHFHIGGISWLLMGLKRQSTCVITADPSPGNIVRLLRDYQATCTFTVATVIRGMIAELMQSGERLPHLQTIFYGAAPIGAELLQQTMQVLGCQLGQFFGMTEATGSLTFLAPRYHDLTKPDLMNSVGKILPGMSLEIRDANGRALPAGSHGEIWACSFGITPGYWQREDATRRAIVDGWYRTGDGGRLDADGFLYLTDRIKDMIVSGGENVYPNEVEAALRTFPGLQDVAVVGLPDAHWGEVVTAIIECSPGRTPPNEAELLAHARQRIAAFKCPKKFVLRPALPRTASGKIQRAQIKADLLAGR